MLPVPTEADKGFHPSSPRGSGTRTPPTHTPLCCGGKAENQGNDLRAGGREPWARFPSTGTGAPRPVSPLGIGRSHPWGGDRRGLLRSAAATGASPARGAARKPEWGAAPSRAAPSAASRTGTRSPACRPRPTCASGAPTTSIPRGESTRLSATPSLDQAFLVQFGVTGPQRAQTMSELALVRQVLLKAE